MDSFVTSLAIKFFMRWVEIRLFVRVHSIRFIWEVFVLASFSVRTKSISISSRLSLLNPWTLSFTTWFECSRFDRVTFREPSFDLYIRMVALQSTKL